MVFNESSISESMLFLEISTKINICFTIIITIIGLIGHFLTLFVYSQKRFRLNSNNIFLFCLAINDSLFLIIHFFEDTIRSIKLNYTFSAKFNLFINRINIVDNSSIICWTSNYLRYTLRLISTFLIITITLQRLYVVYNPLQTKCKSKKSAWFITFIIIIISLVFNSWAIFLFKMNTYVETNIQYCDLDRNWTTFYFYLNFFYTFLAILLPIIVVFTCNFLIIHKLTEKEKERKHLTSTQTTSTTVSYNKKNNKILLLNTAAMNPNVSSIIQMDKNRIKVVMSINKTKKMKKILLLVSFSYAIFNLPYLITW